MFFRLLPEVYLVIGKYKSLLQNILNKKIFWLDNSIAKFIQSCENNKPIPDEFLKCAKELQDNGWGIVTSSPIFVDKLRFVDISDQRQFHKKPPVINHATIKLTDKCNLNCICCGKIFCPSCIKDNMSESLSLSKLESLILNIKKYGCKTILLTGGEIALFPNLKEIYDFITENDLNVILNINGLIKLDEHFIDSNIIISVFLKESLATVIKNYKNFKNVTICTYFENNQNLLLPADLKHIKRSCAAHKITKKSLISADIQKFHIKQTKNSCLNGKIVINQNGEVYPCLESIKFGRTVGNVNNERWENIIKELALKYWDKKIDTRETCGNCEFRYICNSCIFDDVRQNCLYDMEAKIWK